MASLALKNGVYLARFRLGGQSYKRSLRTASKAEAEGALLQVKLALHRLTVGLIQVPPGADPGDFVVSGGTRAAAPGRKPAGPSVRAAVDEYLANTLHLAATTRVTVRVQLNNLLRHLGARADGPVDDVGLPDLQKYVQARLAGRVHTTVAKERATAAAFFGWVAEQGYAPSNPAEKLLKVKSGGDLPAFRTRGEIEAVIARGGLTPREEWGLWDCLYLSTAEIAGLLALVKACAKHPVSYVLHAVPAYTGMRRGEVLRLRWDDVEFDHGGVWARSLKQSRQAVETKRRVDLHPELAAILRAWQADRPRGQYVLCDEGSLGPLERHRAEERFWQPLKGTGWVIPARNNRPKVGFHTYRHSFASNLAAAGVDQRVIDEFMGHTTEAMRKRYRHLFPRAKKSAIESFSLEVAEGGEG